MFPLEIFEMIWDFMPPSHFQECLRVCKSWHQRLIPRLYRKLEFPSSSTTGSARKVMTETMLSHRGHIYLEHVLSLQINVPKLKHVDINGLKRFLSNCRNVTRLKLVFRTQQLDNVSAQFLCLVSTCLPLNKVERLKIEGLEFYENENSGYRNLFTVLLACRHRLSSFTLMDFEESLPDRVLAFIGWPQFQDFWQNSTEEVFTATLLDKFKTAIRNPGQHDIADGDAPVFDNLLSVKVLESCSCSESGAAALMVGPGCPTLSKLDLLNCYSCVLDEYQISVLNKIRLSKNLQKVKIYCDTVDTEDSESDDGIWESIDDE